MHLSDHTAMEKTVTWKGWSRVHFVARNARTKLLLKVLITAGVLFALLRAIDLDLVLQRLTTVDPTFLTLAMILGGAQAVIVMSWRWGIVLRVLGVPVGWFRLVRFMTVSLFFNELMPSTIGGDTARVLLLRGTGRPVGQAIQSVAVERALGLTSLFILAFFGAAALLPLTVERTPLLAIMATAFTALTFIAGLILLTRLGLRLPDGIVQRVAQTLNETVTLLGRAPARLAALISLSFLGQIMIALTVWLVAYALHVPLGIWHAVAIMPAIILVTSVPVSIAEWGIREGAMVVGLGLVGISATDAITVSLVYGVLFLILGMATGLVWLFSGQFTTDKTACFTQVKHTESVNYSAEKETEQ